VYAADKITTTLSGQTYKCTYRTKVQVYLADNVQVYLADKITSVLRGQNNNYT